MSHARKLLGLAVLFAASFGCSKTAQTPKVEVPATAESKIRVSRAETEASEPVIAASPDGKFFVGYVEKDAEGKGDLYVRSFDAPNTLG